MNRPLTQERITAFLSARPATGQTLLMDVGQAYLAQREREILHAESEEHVRSGRSGHGALEVTQQPMFAAREATNATIHDLENAIINWENEQAEKTKREAEEKAAHETAQASTAPAHATTDTPSNQPATSDLPQATQAPAMHESAETVGSTER